MDGLEAAPAPHYILEGWDVCPYALASGMVFGKLEVWGVSCRVIVLL